MTFNSDIQKTEKEIAVLQKKLELLKEIETHKSQPRMEAERSGEVHIVFYNKKTYYRIEYTDEYGYVVWWRREKEEDFWDNASRLVMVTDKETERLLEGVWFNDVKKGKYDDVVDEHKSPVEEAYKDWCGQYPELETDSEYDDMRWQGFRAGYHFAYEEKVKEDNYNDKSQPRMYFELGGKFEIVSYNGENYYRYEFNDKSHTWYKRKHTVDGMLMVNISDGETHRLLEGVWFNEVKKGKYD